MGKLSLERFHVGSLTGQPDQLFSKSKVVMSRSVLQHYNHNYQEIKRGSSVVLITASNLNDSSVFSLEHLPKGTVLSCVVEAEGPGLPPVTRSTGSCIIR